MSEPKEAPDYVYDTENWEETLEWRNRTELGDSLDVGQIMEVGCLKSLPPKFLASVLIGEDDYQLLWFDTREEAEAAVKQAQESQNDA